MISLRQIWAITWMNLQNMPTRIGASLVVVVGIAGVVAVLVSLLAIANGFQATLSETGRPDRALILRSGSDSEINGNISLEQFDIVRNKSGIAHVGDTPLAAMETFVTVKLPGKVDGKLSSFPMRGVTAQSYLVRPEVKVVQGRKPVPGKLELLAGQGVTRRINGFEVGNTLKIRGIDWLVVGRFTSNGSAYESEVWADERLLASLHNRGPTFSSMLVKLNSADRFEDFKSDIEEDRRVTLRVMKESDYYLAQSENTTQLVTAVGIIVASIMSIGAIFAALNTMYAAISTRTREIATLRALGFGDFTIFFTVLIEAEILALLGGVVGGCVTYVFLNDYSVSTVGGTFTQVGFEFQVTPPLLIGGVLLALVLGFIGGAIPAASAIRCNIVDGLKKL